MRTFLAVLGVFALAVCGRDGDDIEGDGESTTGGCYGVDVQIWANHGTYEYAHQLVIPQADIDAGETKSYPLPATAHNDPHYVLLDEWDFQQLRLGMPIEVSASTANFHEHSVKISCSSP